MKWSNRIVGHEDEDPSSLIPHPSNWRKHGASQRTGLAAVLDRVGYVQEVIVNRRTGRLVDGHLRVQLAVDRHEARIPVAYVDLDEAEEALVLATLDPLASLAGTDHEALDALLAGVADADEAVAQLLEDIRHCYAIAETAPRPGIGDPDEVPDVPVPTTRPGDLWRLGPHRIICGDATDHASVGALFAGDHASLLYTDPPYGVDYEGRTRARLRIANDTADGLSALLASAFSEADAVLRPGAGVYCFAPAGPLFLTFGAAFVGAGWHLHQTLVWVKDTFVLGRSDYHYRHEPLLYGWKPPRRRRPLRRDQGSVFEVARPRASAEHPTTKPVELIEQHLRHSTARRALVYDPFLGSGSTLIAAERLERRCFGMELEPRYVDVAVERWQRLTGGVAVHAESGLTFREETEARHGR